MRRHRILVAWLAMPVVLTFALGACIDTSGFASGSFVPGNPEGGAETGTDATPVDAPPGADAMPLPSGAHLFSRSFGGPDEEFLSKGSVDLSGALLLAGSVGSTIDLGGGVLTSGGALDMFFAKLDAKGGHVFSHSFGALGEQDGVNITSNGRQEVFATGVFNGSFDLLMGSVTSKLTATDAAFDALVMRFDPQGTLAEFAVIGGTGMQIVSGLGSDGSRGVFCSGANVGTTNFPVAVASSGGNDLLTAHVMSTQNWANGYGDASEQFGRGAASDASGNVVSVGYFGGAMNLGGTNLASHGGYDLYAMKQTAAGAVVWAMSIGDLNDQAAESVVIDPTGAILVAGTFAGSFDFGATTLTSAGDKDIFLARLDPKTGAPTEVRRFGGTGADTVSALAVDASGNVLLGGGTFGPINFGGGVLPAAGDSDAFVVKLDPQWNHLWSKRLGDAGMQTTTAIGATPTGEVWAAGYFTGVIDPGGGPFTSAGKHDVWIARFTP